VTIVTTEEKVLDPKQADAHWWLRHRTETRALSASWLIATRARSTASCRAWSQIAMTWMISRRKSSCLPTGQYAPFRCEAEFSTWVYRIAVNTTIKQMKRTRARQAYSIDDPTTGLADVLVSCETERPENIAERKARNEALQRAVQELPEKHRAVVVLHYYENLGCDEIARVLECSVGTVWSRLHYACKKLQQTLSYEL